MARVNLTDVSKTYGGGAPAVAELSLEIADGEFMVLIGPSGSGKSTVLNLIAGLEDITSGEVWIGDRLVNQLAPRDRHLAMVFQSYALYPHMTQVGSPDELYLRPVNVFVAGFIGSPAMNLLTGIAGDGVILGVRPEDLAPVRDDADGLRFDAVLDAVESTGADLYAHARIDGDQRIVVRLDPDTRAHTGMRMTLGVARDRIYRFDAASGQALAMELTA